MSRRATLERLERGLAKDLKRTAKRLDMVRELIALEQKQAEVARIAAERTASRTLLTAVCGLIEAHGGEMHVRELEEKLAARAGDGGTVDVYELVRRHPERFVPREHGFFALAHPHRPGRESRAASSPTWPPKIRRLGSGRASKAALDARTAGKRTPRRDAVERPG